MRYSTVEENFVYMFVPDSGAFVVGHVQVKVPVTVKTPFSMVVLISSSACSISLSALFLFARRSS